jgi:GT2 family glycosyltransferase
VHKVVVGITTLNNPEILNNCLKSIYKTHDMYKGLDIKILVIDDCSSGENLERNKEVCASHGVTMLMNKQRLGVAKSWNNISRHFNSEIIILLNDDVEVSNNWIDVMIYTLDNNTEIGVVGFNAYEGDNSSLPANNTPTYIESKIMLGGNMHPILSARGFGFGFRRIDFDNIGGFNSDYFCFFEEVDFNLSMMKYLNKRNCILSYPILKHIHGATTFNQLIDCSKTFNESKKIFELKWNISWDKIRDIFNITNIPKINSTLNEWNSNYNIWG